MDQKAQTNIVLYHLNKYGTITSLEAFEKYSITRLSARIFELRESGFKIGMVWETHINQFGVPTRYGRYFLIH